MKRFNKSNISKFILLNCLLLLPAAAVWAQCSYNGNTISSGNPYYKISGCDTCVSYCCPNEEMSGETCGSVSALSSFSDSCRDKMCEKGYAWDGSDCVDCDNIPSYGYATGTGRYEEVDGYYVCPFECRDGYEKVLDESVYDYGVPEWAEYGECKKISKCESGYTEGTDGTCCQTSKNPSGKTLPIGSNAYEGNIGPSGQYIGVVGSAKLGTAYCRNSKWYASVTSFSCDSPYTKYSDGCYMRPYWTCGQATYTVRNGTINSLDYCTDSMTKTLSNLLDKNPSAYNALAACSSSSSDYGAECAVKVTNTTQRVCECDSGLEYGNSISVGETFNDSDTSNWSYL